MKNTVFLSVVICLVIFSCKKKKNDPVDEVPENFIEVHLNPVFNGERYNLEDVITSVNGYNYFFNRIQIIGTDVKLDGKVFKADFAYDYKKMGTQLFYGKGTPTDFSTMTLNLGIPYDLNHGDPSLPDASSALNIMNANDMHWGWNPGYIFVKLEGKADFTNDGVDNMVDNFTFHLGMDTLLRNLSFSDMQWTKVSSTNNRLDLKLDIKNIFDKSEFEHNLKLEQSSHSTNTQFELSKKIMDNFVNAIKQ